MDARISMSGKARSWENPFAKSIADSATAAIFPAIKVADECGPIPNDMKWAQWREVISGKLREHSNEKNTP